MRETLPNRRLSHSFTFYFGNRFDVHITLFPDNRPAEAFISGGKVGGQVESLARDSAILISLALQHGCSLETIRKALTREENERPSSLAGALVDAIHAEHQLLTDKKA